MGNTSGLRSCLPLSCLVRDDDDKEEMHQLPWLVLDPRKTGRKTGSANWYIDKRFYNLITNQVSNFVMRMPFDGSKVCSSTRGWWFFMDINKCALKAFNPFSASTFHFPPFDTSRFIDPEMLILSKDPLSGSNFEVFAMSCEDELAHFKSGHGDEFWTYLGGRIMKNSYISSAIFFKDRLLCANVVAGQIITLLHLDIVPGGGDGSGIKTVKEIASMPILRGFESHNLYVYLVETTKGDLLVVHRYYDDEWGVDKLMAYRVYKLICRSHDQHEDDFQFIQINDLGGDSLFLMEVSHDSISVLASDYPGCRPNSIYFANTQVDNEIEVFHVEDGSVSKCFIPTDYHKGDLAAWMVPYPPPPNL